MNPGLLFLLVFVGAPVVELYFLIQVGDKVGALTTIGLVLLTAAVGGAIARWQGIGVLLRVRETMQREEVPALEMLEGAVLLIAGLLLLLPGFITDVLGFLCLVPPLRKALILTVLKRARVLQPVPPTAAPGAQHPPLEGEWRRDD